MSEHNQNILQEQGPGPRLRLLTSFPTSLFQFQPRPPALSLSTRPGLPRARLYLTSPLSSTDLTPSRPWDLLFLISLRPCPSGSTGDNLPLPRPWRPRQHVMHYLLTPELPRLPLHLLTIPCPHPCHNE